VLLQAPGKISNVHERFSKNNPNSLGCLVMGTANLNSPTNITAILLGRQPFAIATGLVLLVVCNLGCHATTQRQNVAGRAAFEQGQHAQAINSFQQVLNRDPKNSDAYYNLAACYYEGKARQNKQFVDQAEQLYRQAITYDGQHVDAHRGLVALLIETKREKFAFDVLDGWNIREVQGQNQLALDNYSRALQINNLDQAAAVKVATLQNLIRTGNSGSGTTPQRYGNSAPYLLK